MSSISALAWSSERLSALTAALCLLLLPAAAAAKVFHSQSEALELAFPDAERIDSRTFVLDDEQTARIETLSRSAVDSKLVKIYTGMRDGAVLGYAVIDVHTVRTHSQAFMVVLTPEGAVRSLRVLAFHEPLDYLPNGRWYEQFDRKTADAPLRVGGDVHGIVGATLSASATTRGVRRALAFYQVLIREGES